MGMVLTFAGTMLVLILLGVGGGRLLDWMRVHRAELWNLRWPKPEELS